MAGRWFRFYDETLNDPKVQRLTDASFRAWVNLLCVASKNDGAISGDFAVLAFSLRKPLGKVRELMQVLLSAGLMDRTETGFTPHGWKTRQYDSDSAAERMRRHRASKKDNALQNGDVTRDVTEREPLRPSDAVDTEQIENRTEQKEKRARERAAFNIFWEVCPKKVGKGAAEKAFSKALSETSPEILTAAMRRYGLSVVGKDPTFTKHPATWLNQKCWTDEPDAAPANTATIHVLSPEIRELEQQNLKRMGII